MWEDETKKEIQEKKEALFQPLSLLFVPFFVVCASKQNLHEESEKKVNFFSESFDCFLLTMKEWKFQRRIPNRNLHTPLASMGLSMVLKSKSHF